MSNQVLMLQRTGELCLRYLVCIPHLAQEREERPVVNVQDLSTRNLFPSSLQS